MLNKTEIYSVKAVLFVFPMLALLVKGVASASLFVLALLAFSFMFRARKVKPDADDTASVLFVIAMSSGLVAVLANQLYLGQFNWTPYDVMFRFALVAPIYIALRSINIQTLAVLQYGIPLGAISALLVVLTSGHARATSNSLDLIHFGNLSLLMGFLSICSINWIQKDSPVVVVLKVIGFLAGVYVSMQTGERGGWIAIPVVVLSWIFLSGIENKWKWAFTSLALMTVLGLWAYWEVPVVHDRIELMLIHISAYQYGYMDSPIAVRLQQWKGALLLFIDHPVFGIGPGTDVVGKALLDQGIISRGAALEAFGELHSDVIGFMTKFGLFGLVAILAIYLVPLRLFVIATKSKYQPQRTAGIMGACLVLSYFVFGLTVEMFSLKMVASFYAITIAALLAVACRQERGKDDSGLSVSIPSRE